MAEIVNLRMARKARARLDHERLAAENRARHGECKADRQRRATQAERAARDLDRAKRES